MIGDLHCHTRLSDGSLGLDDLVFYAKRAGLDFIAITDLDTMEGVMRGAILGKRFGVTVIPGVEISAWDAFRDRETRIICYLPRHPDRLQGILGDNLHIRESAGRALLEEVGRCFPITDEHIERYSMGRAVYPCHIMQVLTDLGYAAGCGDPLGRELFAQGGTCPYRPQFPDAAEIAQSIHQAGGIAVLAHPLKTGSLELLEQLAERGLLHGVEVWHPSAGTEEGKLEEMAERIGLLKTGGSGFRGGWGEEPYPIASRVMGSRALAKLFALEKSLLKHNK